MATLESREVEFLQQSALIEEIGNIDYSAPAQQQAERGYAGVWLELRRLAHAGARFSAYDLAQWQGWLVREQLAFGHACPPAGVGTFRNASNRIDVRVGAHIAPPFADVERLMEEWLADYNIAADRMSAPAEVETRDLVAAGGELLQRFEAIHPFADGNGRIGRALVNYLWVLTGNPLLVFRRTERDAFFAAHASQRAMQRFLAGKAREAVPCFCGGVMERIFAGDFADTYACSTCKRERIVEWHELIEFEQP